MTISSTTNRAAFVGNGVTVNFSFPYYFLAAADLVVIETVIATGVQTIKALTTHYTVAGAGVQAGGTVTMLTAPASTVRLTIIRDPALTQGVDLVENDPLPVENAVEAPLDRLTMIAQRQRDLIDRSLRQPDGDSANIDALPAKVVRASKALGFDADGDPIAISPASAVTASDNVTFVPSGIGARTDETAQEKMRQHKSAADFTGYDATGVADSSTAITNAIAATSEDQTLYITGTPLIASTITVNKRISIKFDGGTWSTTGATRAAAYFKKKSTLNGPGVLLTSNGVKVEGGGVVGDAGNGGAGLVIRANGCTVKDFVGASCGTYGIHIDHASAGANCNNWKLDNCAGIGNTSHGIYIDSLASGNANSGTAINCAATDNGGDGFKSNYGFWNTFVGCLAEGNTGWGANFSNGKDNVWVGGDYESNTAGQMNIQSTESLFCLVQKSGEQSITDNGYFTKRLDRAFNKPGTWSPALYGSTGTDKTITAVSVSGSTATMTSALHGYSNSDTVFQTGLPNQNLDGVFVISNVAANTYDITVRTDRSVTPPSNASGLSATARKCGAYSLQVGEYIYKDGAVEFDAALTTSSLTNITGNVYLLLPFPTKSIAGLYTGALIGYHAGVTYTAELKAMPNQNGNYFCELWEDNGGGPGTPSLLQNAALGSPSTFYISGRFYVAQAA